MKIENWKILGIVGLIVLIVFIVFFVFRRTQANVQDFFTRPSILFTDSSYEIVPVENYSIEYASDSAPDSAMYTDAELTDFLNWNINWETKGGFDPVKRIRITRTCTIDSVSKSQSITLTRPTDETDSDMKYFKNFNADVNFPFVGNEFATPGSKSDDVGIGINTFTIEYSTTDTADDFLPMNAVNKLEQTIVRNDVLIPLESEKFTDVPFYPTLNTPNLKETFDDKGYFFYPGDTKDFSLNSTVMGGTLDKKLEIVLSAANSKAVNLKEEGTTNFLINTDNGIRLRTNTETTAPLDLYIITNGIVTTDKYIMLGTISDVPVGSTTVTVTRVDKVIAYEGGKFKLTTLSDINDEIVYSSIKLYYYDTEQITAVNCVLGPIETVACQDKTKTVDGIALTRGQMAKKVKVINPAVGAGTCTHSSFGTTNIEDLPIAGGFRYKVDACPRNCLYEKKSQNIVGAACSKLKLGLPGSCYKDIASRKISNLGDIYGIYPATNGGACPTAAIPSAYECADISRCGDCGYTETKTCDRTTTSSPVQKSVTGYTPKSGNHCFTPAAKGVLNTNPDTTCSTSCISPSWSVVNDSCSAVGKRNRIVTNRSSATADRQLCTNSPAPATNVNDSGCKLCPYSVKAGECVPGSDQMQYNHVYDTTGDNQGCVETGAPADFTRWGYYCAGGGGGGASSGGGMGSDPRLKNCIRKIGVYGGMNVYEWVWNDIATTIYGLEGREIGFLTTELEAKYVGRDEYGYDYIKDGTVVADAMKFVRATMVSSPRK